MSGGQGTAALHRQHVEELCAAAARALSGDLELRFRGARMHRGHRPLALPAHLRPSAEEDGFASFRAVADGTALRLTGSDAVLHAGLRPEGRVERGIFDLLEQFRVEALAPGHMPGMRENLRHRHTQWSLALHRSGLTGTERGLLLYTVLQVCRSRITGSPVVEETEGLLEAPRAALGPLIGHDLAGLRRHRTDQELFAGHALSMARTVARLTVADGSGTEAEGEGGEDTERAGFPLMAESEGEDAAAASTPSPRPRARENTDDGYRVFTTAYDEQRPAEGLLRPAVVQEYRARLDRAIAREGVNLTRLTRELRALLAEPVRDGWEGGQEAGLVDGSLLTQLIASPAEQRLFRTERTEPVADALVTFLIDCSGSMKGHRESLAVLADVFARALELAGAGCEILGFTTRSWNGGRARRDWMRAGRPALPGRLNERRHLVFKDAGTHWRGARPGIAALLGPELFREGVDGEAVRWARDRAESRPEARRLLIVLSDGSPMDGATALTNGRHCLDADLKETVRDIERTGTTEVRGVGVGADPSPYYSRSLSVALAEGRLRGVVRELTAMLAAPRGNGVGRAV